LGGGDAPTYSVIREIQTKNVCQVEDGLVFRVIYLGGSDVCLDAIDLFKRPLSKRGVGVKIDKIWI
jgi:hypothetical protein